MPASTCPKCKFPTSEGAVCRLCGAKLEEAAPPPAPVEEAAAPPAPAEEDPRALGWVCCNPFQPILMHTHSEPISIGRTGENDLPLPHHAVSRCHVMILVRDGELRCEDASSNGTFLNGKRVDESDLRVGDVLTIGPYDLEITAENPEHTQSGSCTSEIDFTNITSGLIEDTPLVETLQGLEFNEKSGTLQIMSGRLRGFLVIEAGIPREAVLGEVRDEEAVFAMLDLKEGRFVFSPNREPGERTMKRSVTALLLEHSRRSDEGTVDG